MSPPHRPEDHSNAMVDDGGPGLIVILPPSSHLNTAPGFRIIDVSAFDSSGRNLAVLSARADVALILVDAAFGLDKRDRWHKLLVCLARIQHVVLAVDNLANHHAPQERFDEIAGEFAEHIDAIDCGAVYAVPMVTGAGEADAEFAWYRGPNLDGQLSQLREQVIADRTAVVGAAPLSSDQFAVHLAWSGDKPMLPGRSYTFVLGNQRTKAHVGALKHRINPATLEHQAATQLLPGDLGYANIALTEPVSFLPFETDRAAGSFWLEDAASGEKLAFGLIRRELRRATNIRWHALQVDKVARAAAKGQVPCVLWFTGLSGSGKSTIATLIDKQLHAMGKHTYLLDGDNVRHGLCRDLGFTDADRVENLRRVGETAKLFVDAGLIVLVSFISPFRTERRAARALFGEREFIEIFVDTPLEVCEARDPKGLYKKARSGQLKNFTGIDSVYEQPEQPDIRLSGMHLPAEQLADLVIEELAKVGKLS